MKNALDEMAIKVNDFNVYDLFKDISDSGGDVEASKILIQALDKKMQERFKFQDEKIKNDEQETLKVKTEVTNLKNTTSFDKRNLTTIKEQIIKLQNEVDSNKKNLSEKVSKNQNEIDSVREKELQSLENLNNEIKDLMNRINNLSNKVDLINEEREIEKELRKK
jgi:chromosome segregation ATPase